MLLLTPAQATLIITAWAELEPHSLLSDKIRSNLTELVNCIKHWDSKQLIDSRDMGFEDKLLIALGKQTYLLDKRHSEAKQLLVGLVSIYRLALVFEGETSFAKPNQRSGHYIDWLSLATIDREDYLAKDKSNLLRLGASYIVDDFFQLHKCYFNGGIQSADLSRCKISVNCDYSALAANVSRASLDQPVSRNVDVRQYDINYSYDIAQISKARSIRVTIIFDLRHYKISDERLLLQRIVKSDVFNIYNYEIGESYLMQAIGRSCSVDEAEDWTDLSGLPGLSINPVLHLGRFTPFFIHVSANTSPLNTRISRLALLADDILYLGMFDTFGSVLYYQCPLRTGSTATKDSSELMSYPKLPVDIYSLIPGFSTSPYEYREANGLGAEPCKSYFLEKALSGSALLASNSYTITRVQADLASIKYFSDCGEIYSNLEPAVVNGSLIATEDKHIYIVWRYEPNFNSWSGRMVDSFRTMCRLFLFKGHMGEESGSLTVLNVVDFPDDSWVEDIRLFSHNGTIAGTAALFMPALRLDQNSLSQSSNNTGTGMMVSQCLVEVGFDKSELRFKGFLNLAEHANGKLPNIPAFFEKNWAIWNSPNTDRIVYSVEPWLSLVSVQDGSYHLDYSFDSSPSIKKLLGGTPRLSCNLESLHMIPNIGNLSIGFFHVRDENYSYSQYPFLVDNVSGRPVCWNSLPFLSVATDFYLSSLQDHKPDLGLKNKGVCYLSSIYVLNNALYMVVNMFDSELYIMSVSLDYIMSLLTDGSLGYCKFRAGE